MASWIDPDLGPAGAAVLALLAAWFVVRIARSPGTVARRRAEIESRPDGRVRFHQRYILSWWLVAGAALLPLLTGAGVHPDDYGLRWPGAGGAAFAGAVFVFFLGVVRVRDRFLRRRLPAAPPQIAFLLPRTGVERLWGVGTAFTAGICEELVFRGAFLAGAVGGLHLNLWVATALVSLFFGLGHLYQGVAGVVGTAVFGACATVLYVFSGSLLVPVLVHAAVDLGPFALSRYEPPAPADAPTVGSASPR